MDSEDGAIQAIASRNNIRTENFAQGNVQATMNMIAAASSACVRVRVRVRVCACVCVCVCVRSVTASHAAWQTALPRRPVALSALVWGGSDLYCMVVYVPEGVDIYATRFPCGYRMG